MLARVFSAALIALDVIEIEIEVEARVGLPHHIILGLPDAAVKESKQRIESAIKNSGFEFQHNKRLTINLAPADIHKKGSVYDLPMAVGAVFAFSELSHDLLKDVLILGELNLQGEVKPINGILAFCEHALKKGYKKIILPFHNKNEVVNTDIEIYPVKNLQETLGVLRGSAESPKSFQGQNELISDVEYQEDFKEVKGQFFARRALEIAAAGAHNVLLIGSPGCGKTMMARRFPSILPKLSFAEAIEVAKIYSVSGLLKNQQKIRVSRPFRSPHHTISNVAIAGGGRIPRPGEVTLAHRGVLFLDEFTEFDRSVLEVLRQPLEDGMITVSRAACSTTFPSQFILIAAMNPCPCGYLNHPLKKCSCTTAMVQNYWKKISGPILDRIDMIIEVPF